MTTKLKQIANESGLYFLDSSQFSNKYFIISREETRHLMASPEVVGFDSYKAMVPGTRDALAYLKEHDSESLRRVNILTILRGGLNYPIEEACHNCEITVSDMSFISCERIIVDGVITGLDVKYEKLHTEDNCTLVIGDIIASGETLRLCLSHVIDMFRSNGHSIRKIIFFTIGGTKAISLMEEFTRRIRQFWPSFEGFECVFYEGIFTVYEDKGVTGVNTPDIDFGWKGGYIAPEFREYVIDYEYAPALLEKCVIYDGGARRYNIGDHHEEVVEYWTRLAAAASKADYSEFIDEKFGYPKGTSYEEWLELACYPQHWKLEKLYSKELEYAEELHKTTLSEVCEKRLLQIERFFDNYLNK